jgi:hypothetical protein
MPSLLILAICFVLFDALYIDSNSVIIDYGKSSSTASRNEVECREKERSGDERRGGREKGGRLDESVKGEGDREEEMNRGRERETRGGENE